MKVRIIARQNGQMSCRVQLIRQQCETCVGTCGLRSVGRLQREGELWVNSPDRVFSCGEYAELVVSSSALSLAAVIVFVIPMVFLLLAVAIATIMGFPEKMLFVVAGFGLTAGLSVSVVCGLQFDWLKIFDPQLASVGNRSEP